MVIAFLDLLILRVRLNERLSQQSLLLLSPLPLFDNRYLCLFSPFAIPPAFVQSH